MSLDVSAMRAHHAKSTRQTKEARARAEAIEEGLRKREMTQREYEQYRRGMLYKNSSTGVFRKPKIRRPHTAGRLRGAVTGDKEEGALTKAAHYKSASAAIEERLKQYRKPHTEPWKSIKLRGKMDARPILTWSRPEDAADEPEDWRPPLTGNPADWPAMTHANKANMEARKHDDIAYKWMFASTDPDEPLMGRPAWTAPHTNSRAKFDLCFDINAVARKHQEDNLERGVLTNGVSVAEMRRSRSPSPERDGPRALRPSTAPPGGRAGTPMAGAAYSPPLIQTARQRKFGRTMRGDTGARRTRKRPVSAALRMATASPPKEIIDAGPADATPPPEARKGRGTRMGQAESAPVLRKSKSFKLMQRVARELKAAGEHHHEEEVKRRDLFKKPLKFESNYGFNPASTKPVVVGSGRYAEPTRSFTQAAKFVPNRRQVLEQRKPIEGVRESTNERLKLTGEKPLRVGGAVQHRSLQQRKTMRSGSTLLHSGVLRRDDVEAHLSERGVERERRINSRESCIKWLTHHPLAQRLEFSDLLRWSKQRVKNDRENAAKSHYDLVAAQHGRKAAQEALRKQASFKRGASAKGRSLLGGDGEPGLQRQESNLGTGGFARPVILSRAQFMRAMRNVGFESKTDMQHVNKIFSSYDIDATDKLDMSFFCNAYATYFTNKKGVIMDVNYKGDVTDSGDKANLALASTMGGQNVGQSLMARLSSAAGAAGPSENASLSNLLDVGNFYRPPATLDLTPQSLVNDRR